MNVRSEGHVWERETEVKEVDALARSPGERGRHGTRRGSRGEAHQAIRKRCTNVAPSSRAGSPTAQRPEPSLAQPRNPGRGRSPPPPLHSTFPTRSFLDDDAWPQATQRSKHFAPTSPSPGTTECPA